MTRREKLILSNLDLVRQIARSVAKRTRADLEELEADGMIGLIEAAGRYKKGLNDSFRHYASRRIRGAMYDGFRKLDTVGRHEREMRKKHPERVEEKAHKQFTRRVYVEEDHVWETLLKENEDQIAHLERKYLREMLSILPQKQRVIMEMYFFQDKNLKEIADHYGVTESRICQIRLEAMNTLHAHLVQNGFDPHDH